MTSTIDLHLHSTASDGVFPPGKVVELAHQAGMSTIALADHDSVAGIAAATAAGRAYGMVVIPAVELSVAYKGYGDVHLLGYWIDHLDPGLVDWLDRFRVRRESRGLSVVSRINDKLRNEGRKSLDPDDVLSRAEGALGRPHIARALMDAGHVSTMQEAFDRYLEPCNVPKEYLPFTEALAEIHRTGGVGVLAHPQSISRRRPELATIIEDMARLGLDGIEAINTMGIDDDETFLCRLARSLCLCVTGGSDFHGDEPAHMIGSGRGNLRITDEILAELTTYRAKRGTPCC
jgi:predicted metal-dependent phosphoesterase TrpH